MTITKSFLPTLLGLVLSLSFCGCRHQTESAPPLDSIRELLNQREYDQAIIKLENYRKKQPDDQEATLLLATAYTGSTGVNLIDSYSFFSKLLMEKPQNPRSAPGARSQSGANPIDGMAQLIRKYLASLAKESDIFFAIPYVNQNQRSRLVEALLLLKVIPDDDSVAERARAYQGFLHLLQFSNYTKDMFPQVDFNGPVTVIDLICTLNTQDFLNQMHYGLVYLTELLGDAEWILTRKNRKLPAQLLDLRTQVNDLKTTFSAKFNPASQGTVLLESLKNGYCS